MLQGFMKGARAYADDALYQLGSVGKTGTKARASLERAATRAGKNEGVFGGALNVDRNADIALRRRQQLLGMGKKRAIVGGVGLGAIGVSSGASGMRAKSSGGFTG